ncbi:MAG: S1 family peptidase [Archangiaceae bacterium]|nr:S1 family peptidase [Archangiaceae bacterium]
MRRLVCCLLGITACGPTLEAPPESAQQAIINGTVSLWDAQVFALGSGNSGMFCTATLISERTLLTAAHCVEAVSGTITVSNQTDVRGWPGDAIAVVDRRVHPRWVGGDTSYDVGLLLLASAPSVTPKAWNRAPLKMPQLSTVRALGYGETHLDGSGVRYEAPMRVSSLTSTTVYLGDGRDAGAATCFGDSGGPSMFTDLDAVERVVGVHSFANSAECNGGGDLRVDAVADFIDQWTRDKAPTCALDGACVGGCSPADLDCLCLTDGACGEACPLPDTDPDCPKSCLPDGVCAFGTCGVPDPDCQEDGASCASSEKCSGHQCLTDAQHDVAYCSRVCHADEECSPAMRCSFGVCRYPVLPLATMGQGCVVGRTLCSGGTCGGQSDDTATCRVSCDEGGVCPGTMKCVSGVHGVRYCQGPATLPEFDGEAPAAGKRCSASGAEVTLLLAVVFTVARRRSRSG